MLESISLSDRMVSWFLIDEYWGLMRKVLYGKKPGLVFWGHIVCLQVLGCGPWPALYWRKSTDSRKSGWISLDDRELREQRSNRNPTSCVCKGTIPSISSSNPMLLTLWIWDWTSWGNYWIHWCRQVRWTTGQAGDVIANHLITAGFCRSATGTSLVRMRTRFPVELVACAWENKFKLTEDGLLQKRRGLRPWESTD